MLTLGPLNDATHIRHGFFSRGGGVSGGAYESLNCGYGSGDAADNVTRNRARAMEMLELEGGRLVSDYQCHSDYVS